MYLLRGICNGGIKINYQALLTSEKKHLKMDKR
jgi:hypothetical protein